MRNLSKIWKYIKPYKWNAFGNITFNVLQVFFSLSSLVLIIPFLGILFEQQPQITVEPEFSFSPSGLSNYFNYYVSSIIQNDGKTHALLFVSIIVSVLIFLKNFFVYFASWLIVPLRNGVIETIRNNLYHKILNLPLSYYTEERKGDIISKISNDVKEIEFSIVQAIVTTFRDPFTVMFYFAALIWMSPELTLFIIVLLPSGGVIIGLIGKSLRKDSKDAQLRLGNLLSLVEETLSGLRIVKAFTSENKINDTFKDKNYQYTRVMNRISRKRYLASPMSEFLGVIVMVILMYYGGSMVLEGNSSLTAQEFIGYIAVFSQIINPAKKLSSASYDIRKGLASIERINVILKAENNIHDKKDSISASSFDKEIEYKNVSFAYDELTILKNIYFKIEKGQTVALVGQSGSGKTTIVDLLPRFYDIDEGEILIDNVNIKNIKLNDLRNLMGNVNQEPFLFNDTIYNNIAFANEKASKDEIENAAKIANAHDFITETENGYNTIIGDRGTKLSGGQRQRLSIARAILKNPPILILDEATSALDTESEKLVQEALEKLMKDRTSIVIAHRLSTVKNADVIYVLDKGEICEQGKHDDLLKLNGRYKTLYDLQNS